MHIRITLCLLIVSAGVVQAAAPSSGGLRTPRKFLPTDRERAASDFSELSPDAAAYTPRTEERSRTGFFGLFSPRTPRPTAVSLAEELQVKKFLHSSIKKSDDAHAVRMLRMQLAELITRFSTAPQEERPALAQQFVTIIAPALKKSVALTTGRNIPLCVAALWHWVRYANLKDFDDYYKLTVGDFHCFRLIDPDALDEDIIANQMGHGMTESDAKALIKLYTPREDAAQERERIQIFLAEGEKTVLDYAIECGMGRDGDELGLHVIKFLLSCGADPSPIMEEYLSKRPRDFDETVRELVRHSRITPTDQTNWISATADAAVQGTSDRAQGFIQSAYRNGMGHILVNSKNLITSKTPLHYAVQSPADGSLQMMKLLLESGAHVDIRDKDGHTAFEYLDRPANKIPNLEIKGLTQHMSDDLHIQKRALRDAKIAQAKAAAAAGEEIEMAEYVTQTPQIKRFVDAEGYLIWPDGTRVADDASPAAAAVGVLGSPISRASAGVAGSRSATSTLSGSADATPLSQRKTRHSRFVTPQKLGPAFDHVADDDEPVDDDAAESSRSSSASVAPSAAARPESARRARSGFNTGLKSVYGPLDESDDDDSEEDNKSDDDDSTSGVVRAVTQPAKPGAVPAPMPLQQQPSVGSVDSAFTKPKRK